MIRPLEYQYAYRVTATQWDGSKERAEHIIEWSRSCSVPITYEDGFLYIEVSPSGRLKVEPRWWIYRKETGLFDAMPPAVFARTFRLRRKDVDLSRSLTQCRALIDELKDCRVDSEARGLIQRLSSKVIGMLGQSGGLRG